MASSATADAAQPSFDDVDELLRDVGFVVVDLETTGTAVAGDAITEIGAVKVRGGECLGEFATLVRPSAPIPPRISALTGITDAMVSDAPAIGAVLPAFLEFSRGCALVAHNAPFDIGFLRAASELVDIPWPRPVVIDTVRLARAVLPREEVPSVRLAVLADLFGARTRPDHRALSDARATVDVLHALLERLGSLGVMTLPELVGATRRIDPRRRRRRHLADGLPHAPGVYLFRGAADEVLYVGKSRDLRTRVLSYFTASETRRRIADMVLLAARVDHVECATELEAHIREQRLIAAHLPPFNRRSRTPNKTYWIRHVRGHVVVSRTRPADTACLGPFAALAPARRARDALVEVAADDSALAGVFDGCDVSAIDALMARLGRLVADGNFYRAARARDDCATVVEALMRMHRLTSLAVIEELVAARPDDHGYAIAIVRYGRLAAAGRAARGVNPYAVIAMLRASAETVVAVPGPLGCASAEETATIATWLCDGRTRLVSASAPWSQPARGGRYASFAATARAAAAEYDHTERRRRGEAGLVRDLPDLPARTTTRIPATA